MAALGPAASSTSGSPGRACGRAGHTPERALCRPTSLGRWSLCPGPLSLGPPPLRLHYGGSSGSNFPPPLVSCRSHLGCTLVFSWPFMPASETEVLMWGWGIRVIEAHAAVFRAAGGWWPSARPLCRPRASRGVQAAARGARLNARCVALRWAIQYSFRFQFALFSGALGQSVALR